MGVLSLPVKDCLFNTDKIEDRGDMGKLLMFFQILIRFFRFSGSSH